MFGFKMLWLKAPRLWGTHPLPPPQSGGDSCTIGAQIIRLHNYIVLNEFHRLCNKFYIAELVSNYFLGYVISCVVAKHTICNTATALAMITLSLSREMRWQTACAPHTSRLCSYFTMQHITTQVAETTLIDRPSWYMSVGNIQYLHSFCTCS